MNEDLMLLRRMPWKHKVFMFYLSVVSLVMCWLSFDSHILVIKGFLFSIILLVASYFDIKTRIIPDWIHFLLIIIGLLNLNTTRAVAGLIISPLPFLTMALIDRGSIGGGDIKLIGSSGFILGYMNTMLATIIGIIVAVCFYCLYYLSYKKVENTGFPFAPFIQVGCMIVLFAGEV